MAITYVCKRLTKITDRGNKWELSACHDNGDMTYLGHHQTRKGAITAARLLAGWRGKVKVVE